MSSGFEKLYRARGIATEYNLSIPDINDHLDFDTPFFCPNGIKMGDPGAKGTLTLMSLLANDEAQVLQDEEFENFDYLQEFGFQVKEDTNDPFMFVVSHRQGWAAHQVAYDEGQVPDRTFPDQRHYSKDWKQPNLFSTAGDDQAAIATLGKLRQIAKNHVTNSMVISAEKDLISPLLLMYCERAALRTTDNRMARSFVKDDYFSHMLIDNLKLRLLSPESKAQESSNDTNPAIGKAKALTKLVKTLPPGWQQIRDRYVWTRFKQRFFAYLPRLTNGFIDPIVNLPSELGGLGLAQCADDALASVLAISEDHARTIQLLLEKDKDRRVPVILRLFSRDRFARGMRFEVDNVDELFENLNNALDTQPLGLRETAKRNQIDLSGGLGYFAQREILTEAGFIGDKELKNLFSRSALQTKLLTEKTTNGWNSSPWDQRRKAFERSCKQLHEVRAQEGRASFEGPLDRMVLYEDIKKKWDIIPNLTFNEEVFYDNSMTQTSFLFEEIADCDPATLSSRPIEQIFDSLVTLELPAINNRGWFEHKRAKQTIPEDGEI